MKLKSVNFCSAVALPGGAVEKNARSPQLGEEGSVTRYDLEWNPTMTLIQIKGIRGDAVYVPIQNVASFVMLTPVPAVAKEARGSVRPAPGTGA